LTALEERLGKLSHLTKKLSPTQFAKVKQAREKAKADLAEAEANAEVFRADLDQLEGKKG
jgi:hypothetical protein